MSLLYYMYMDYIFIWCVMVYLCQNSKRINAILYSLTHTADIPCTHSLRYTPSRYSGDKVKLKEKVKVFTVTR